VIARILAAGAQVGWGAADWAIMLDPISIANLRPESRSSAAKDVRPEELFARFLLKEVRKAMPESLGGQAVEAFGDLVDEEIARRIADSGQLNLSGKPRPSVPHAVNRYAGVAQQRAQGVGRVTSGFGDRVDPISGEHRDHEGVDIAAPRGTPIRALDGGQVVFAGERGGYGQVVVLEHANGLQTRYAHCSRLGVDVGDTVAAGQVVGAVGSTGRSTGPHVHLEVRRGEVPVNPDEFYDTTKILNSSGK